MLFLVAVKFEDEEWLFVRPSGGYVELRIVF